MPQMLVRSLMSLVLSVGALAPALSLAAPSAAQDRLSIDKSLVRDAYQMRWTPSAAPSDEVDPRDSKDFEASERTTLMDSDISYEDRQQYKENNGVQ